VTVSYWLVIGFIIILCILWFGWIIFKGYIRKTETERSLIVNHHNKQKELDKRTTNGIE
jgi:hypothetical protein